MSRMSRQGAGSATSFDREDNWGRCDGLRVDTKDVDLYGYLGDKRWSSKTLPEIEVVSKASQVVCSRMFYTDTISTSPPSLIDTESFGESATGILLISPVGCAFSKERSARYVLLGRLSEFSEYAAFTSFPQPMLPSISRAINWLSSTAYSIGNSRVKGSKKPLTISASASSSVWPRLIR